MVTTVEIKANKAKTPTANTRPEVNLLLCCVQTCTDSASVEQIKALLQEDIDWEYLIQTALRHGVMPLFYWNLNTICPEAVPKVIMGQFRDYFHSLAQRNLFLTEELLKLLNLFEAYGIPAIPFKGPVLAASAYGNLALRQFGDLDILVHKRDFLKAKDLLICQGYRHQYFGEHEVAYLQSQLLRADGKVNVDLHWGNTPKKFYFSLDPEPMWEYLEPVSLGNTTVLTFSPENSLLILFTHGLKEGWPSLNRICDVAEIIRVHQGMNWGRLMKQVSSLRCERRFFLCLLLARDLLGTTLPEEISQRIQSIPVLKLLAAQVRKRLFCKVFIPRTTFERFLNELRQTDLWQDRALCFLGFLHRTITPNEYDWASLPLPRFLYFLYYLLRPIRLVRKYGLVLLKRFPGI